MANNKDEIGDAAVKTIKPFQLVFTTPRQRELAKRDREISNYCRRERDKGSAKLYIYGVLAGIYGLSASHISKICRREARYA